MAEGLSVYEELEQAAKIARAKPQYGRFVATMELPDDDPSVEYKRTGTREGHHTVWLNPIETQSIRAPQFVTGVALVH